MMKHNCVTSFTVLTLGAALLATTGCQQLPGSPGTQGAAIGGVGGAATGALVGGERHRLLGALVGGAVGAGGGYLIGANKDRIMNRDTTGAEAAIRNAQAHPATPQEALNAPTADLNGDGFVTMDEVVAMRQAGLTDQQILDRIRATGQVFELTPEQQSYLRTNGVDQFVIDQIPQINREVRDNLLNQPATSSPTGAPVYQQAPPCNRELPTGLCAFSTGAASTRSRSAGSCSAAAVQPVVEYAGAAASRTLVGFTRRESRFSPRC